jgi:hypothetical protein
LISARDYSPDEEFAEFLEEFNQKHKGDKESKS